MPNEDFSLEEIEDHKHEASRIGTIKVSVYDMEEGIFVDQNRSRGARDEDADEALMRQDVFAEKAVKGDRALTHSVDFGYRREMPYGPSYRDGLVKKSVWADPRKRPFAEFEFRYRSMEGLIQEAIVSRTDHMDDEQVRQYAQTLERDNLRLQAQNGRKRAAPANGGDGEHQNKRMHMDVDPVVIDLTQDDEEEDDYWW